MDDSGGRSDGVPRNLPGSFYSPGSYQVSFHLHMHQLYSLLFVDTVFLSARRSWKSSTTRVSSCQPFSKILYRSIRGSKSYYQPSSVACNHIPNTTPRTLTPLLTSLNPGELWRWIPLSPSAARTAPYTSSPDVPLLSLHPSTLHDWCPHCIRLSGLLQQRVLWTSYSSPQSLHATPQNWCPRRIWLSGPLQHVVPWATHNSPLSLHPSRWTSYSSPLSLHATPQNGCPRRIRIS